MTEQQREAFEALEQIEAVAGWTTTEEIERLTAIVRAALSHAEGEALRYTSDGALAECPCCGSLDVGGASHTVHCYMCGLTIRKDGPLKNAEDAWNKRTGRTHPAPQVAVPAAKDLDALKDREDKLMAAGWNECLAAMLAAAAPAGEPEFYIEHKTLLAQQPARDSHGLLQLLREARSSVDYHADAQRPETPHGPRLKALVARIDSALSAPAPDERKNSAPLLMIADRLYQAGYEDAKKERDYDPRACVEWQAAIDAMSAPDERKMAARALDKVAKELALRAIPGGVDDALERSFCVNTLRAEADRLRAGKGDE